MHALMCVVYLISNPDNYLAATFGVVCIFSNDDMAVLYENFGLTRDCVSDSRGRVLVMV